MRGYSPQNCHAAYDTRYSCNFRHRVESAESFLAAMAAHPNPAYREPSWTEHGSGRTSRSTRRRWLDTNLMALLRRMLTALTQPRSRNPRRELVYFESARMSRAMDRL
jgi:hypothetical protein